MDYSTIVATKERQATVVRARNPANVVLIPEILQNLDNIIREHNVFFAAFKTLHEVELHEAEQAQSVHTLCIYLLCFLLQ